MLANQFSDRFTVCSLQKELMAMVSVDKILIEIQVALVRLEIMIIVLVDIY
jgi:hypothetical protein